MYICGEDLTVRLVLAVARSVLSPFVGFRSKNWVEGYGYEENIDREITNLFYLFLLLVGCSFRRKQY